MTRINARLDDARDQKLRYLARETNASVSEVVKRAIDLYYEQTHPKKSAFEILNGSGFIGMGKAETDARVSENYKSILADALLEKHDHR